MMEDTVIANIVDKAAKILAINLEKKIIEEDIEFDTIYVFTGVSGKQNERYGWECIIANEGIGVAFSSIDFACTHINIDTNVPFFGLFDSKSKVYEQGLLKKVSNIICEYLGLKNIESKIIDYTIVCKIKNE